MVNQSLSNFLKCVLKECNGLLSEVWINTVQHSEELTCNIFRRPKGKEGIAIQFREIQCTELESLVDSSVKSAEYSYLVRSESLNIILCTDAMREADFFS